MSRRSIERQDHRHRAVNKASKSDSSDNTLNRLLVVAAVVSSVGLIFVFLFLPPTDKPSRLQPDSEHRISKPAPVNLQAAAPATSAAPSLELPKSPAAITTEAEQKRLLSEVERAVQDFPKDASVHHIAALTYKELLQTERARDLFKQSLALDPGNSEVVVAFAGLLTQIGEQEEALATLSQAYKRGLSSEPLLIALGEAYSETGQLDAAVSSFELAVELGSDHSPAHLPLAQTLLQLERFDEAEQQARTALAQDPTNRAAFIALSTALIRQDKKDEALKVRSEMPKIATQVMPDDKKYQESFRSFAANTYSMLGTAYLSHDSLTSAEKALIRSLELNPASATSAMLLGDLLRKEGRINDCIAVYERLTEIQPDNLLNFHNLASLAISTGNIALAESAMRRVAKADASGTGDLQLARFLLGIDNIDESATHAQLAVDRLGSVDAYLVLIAAHRAKGDKAAAFSAYVKAREIAPGDPRLANFQP